jgi:hypothetical protein
MRIMKKNFFFKSYYILPVQARNSLYVFPMKIKTVISVIVHIDM